MIVSKFGGTSVGSFEAMQRSAQIIASNPDRRLIVISAVSGTTNDLIALSKSDLAPTSQEKILVQIEKRHHDIIESCENKEAAYADFENEFSKLRSHFDQVGRDKRWKDALFAFGEMLSTKIFIHVLKQYNVDALWLDARDVIKTDSAFGTASPTLSSIKKNAKKYLKQEQIYLTQGFMGADIFGNTTTLGRGGSDFSAALFAEAVGADTLEIWTDVAGVFTTDPRIVPDALPIHEISFDEAAELSVFGGKVLHPATLKPAIRAGIGVKVLSAQHPDEPGTVITQHPSSTPTIRAIALRESQTLLTVKNLKMHYQPGFLPQLFQLFANHNVIVDLVSTSEVSVALTVDTASNSANKIEITENLVNEIREFAELKIETDLALVALIGNDLHSTSGIGGPIFMELEEFNIRLICYGASSNNLCFLVDGNQVAEIVEKLHKKFIEKEVLTN